MTTNMAKFALIFLAILLAKFECADIKSIFNGLSTEDKCGQMTQVTFQVRKIGSFRLFAFTLYSCSRHSAATSVNIHTNIYTIPLIDCAKWPSRNLNRITTFLRLVRLSFRSSSHSLKPAIRSNHLHFHATLHLPNRFGDQFKDRISLIPLPTPRPH